MLERMKSVLKNRKAEGDKGFSLVELAVVIVIIGILVAVAVPVFANMQTSAKIAAAETGAANGAAMAAAGVASGADDADIVADVAGLSEAGKVTVAITPTTGITLDNYCITSTAAGVSAADGGEIKKGNC